MRLAACITGAAFCAQGRRVLLALQSIVRSSLEVEANPTLLETFLF
jgi:hypothetical protein